MPLSVASRRDTDGRCSRDRAASDPEAAERLRSVRERLEATVSGLEELDYLRQRQEVLVRAALQEEERRTEGQLSSEEKLLAENILLLRKQLNCLRRRDTSLIGQLQELDRQISDLQLDTEVSHDEPETDSRPSSGFYELSDGPSLSNSSNSVFSDNDGHLPSADELAGCLDCDGLVGGLCDDSSSSGTVRRSLSAPHPPTLDLLSSCDVQSKYHCDLVAQNGNDVYRYPSPLHAVAVQSPAFLQMLGYGGHSRDEAGVDGFRQEPSPLSGSVSARLVPQSSSWPVPSSSSQTPSQRHLDSYIYSLLQRRAQPIRTSRPRTSISIDPSKSILRQAGLCARQVSGSGLGTLRGSELKPSWPAGGASAEDAASSSPQRRRSVDRKSEEQDTPSGFNTDPSSAGTNTNRLPPSADFREQPSYQELLTSPPAVKTPKNNLKPQTDQTEKEVFNLGYFSQSQDEAGGGGGSHMVNLPAQQQNVKLRKNVKTVKVKTMTTMSQGSEQSMSERRGDRSYHRSGSKKSWMLEDGGPVHIKISKRAAGGGGGVHVGSSSRIKRFPASIPKGRVLDKHTASTTSSVRSGASRYHHRGNHNSGNQHHHSHHQHLGRDQVVVVAKPKHKRSDYRRLRAIMEVPYDDAFKRSRQWQRKELLSHSVAYGPSDGPMSSPYSYMAGSDSEYSADCASLFHSTIMDTSEDDRSNYTTNCFGDSESGKEEYVEESTATSDTEESGGGGAGTGGTGRGRSQLGAPGSRATGQEVTPAQAKAFVKIKASHNLKRKILRFRSGSLKLMTTV